MITLKEAKRTFSLDTVSDSHFLKVHYYSEGYLKRLLFIGLRLNGVQYKTAQQIIVKYHEPLGNMIEQAWNQVGLSCVTIRKDNRYKMIEDYFLHFSAKFRNYRVHGIYDKLNDDELLRILIAIDRNYIYTCEAIIERNGKPSAFSTPGSWGARTGKKESLEDAFKRVFKNKVKPKTQKYSKEEAKDCLAKLGIRV